MNRTRKPSPTNPVRESETQTNQRRAHFTHLILRHEEDLLRFARRMCAGDSDRAQDLVQEALVHAYQAFMSDRFSTGGNADAWLRRIVTNLYINDYRHRRRWDAEVDLNAPAVYKRMAEVSLDMARRTSPVALLMADTLDEAVERALASLPEKLRLCAVLVDIEGQEYAQAALSLDIPIGTVRSRLFRSRLLLKPLLHAYAEARRQIPESRCGSKPA